MGLRAGDHIFSGRVGYYHHGIYIGDGRVIHFGSPRSMKTDKSRIIETSIEAFQEEYVGLKTPIYTVKYVQCAPNEEVIQRSKRLLEECEHTGLFRGRTYDLVTNNCEHFATYCKTGIAQSLQIKWLQNPFEKLQRTVDTIADATHPVIAGIGAVVLAPGTAIKSVTNYVGGSMNAVAESIVDQVGRVARETSEEALAIRKEGQRDMQAGRVLMGSVKVVTGIAGEVVSGPTELVADIGEDILRSLRRMFRW